jgi:general secretion pathway protein G
VKRRAGIGSRARSEAGFTLVELVILCALIGIVAAIAVPIFGRVVERARLARLDADLRAIEIDLEDYQRAYDEYPDTLDQLKVPLPVDPWGRSYQYLVFRGSGWRGQARKDRFLVPINSAYDLYSLGPDGESRPPLQAQVSLDDFIRANDGAYHGLARDY